MTALYWVSSWSFEHSLANGYTIRRINFYDIHIVDSADWNTEIVLCSRVNDTKKKVENIVDNELKNRTSIVVPPKIVLLMQNGDIVYGYNVSIRQKYGAGKGLPSSYFGWFVLDTKKRKCWLGLTIEELGVILDDYQIERLGFGKTDFRQRRHQKWEIDYNFIDKILMYVTPTLLTIAIIVICKIVMMVLLWVQRSLSWLELTDID